MKGMAQETIVKIILALIVLGVIVSLLYLGLGPFRDSVAFNGCKALLAEWCTLQTGDFPKDFSDTDGKCSGNFGGRGDFCDNEAVCKPGSSGGAIIDCEDV